MSNWLENIRDIRISRRGLIRKTMEIGAGAGLAGAAAVLGISIGEAQQYSEQDLIIMAQKMAISKIPPSAKDYALPKLDKDGFLQAMSLQEFKARFNALLDDAEIAVKGEGGKIDKNEIFFGKYDFPTASGGTVEIEAGYTNGGPGRLFPNEKVEIHPLPDRLYRRITIHDTPPQQPVYETVTQVATVNTHEIVDGFRPRVYRSQIVLTSRQTARAPGEILELTESNLANIAFTLREDFNRATGRIAGPRGLNQA